MKLLFRLIVLAAIVYGAWYVYKNYQVQDWWAKCLPQVKAAQIQKCLAWPKHR